MKKTIILWFGALVITFLAGYLNSVTSPDFPVSGTVGYGKKKVTYYFEKEYSDRQPYSIMLRTDAEEVRGNVVVYTQSRQDTIPLRYADNKLTASFDSVAIGTTLSYNVFLQYEGKERQVPEGVTVKTLIQGYIPKTIKVLYFLTLFGGILLAVRAGLDYFTERKNHKKNGLFALISLACFSLIVVPVKISYQYGLVGSMKAVPPGELFPIAQMSFFVIWLTAMIAAFKMKESKLAAAIGAALIVLAAVFITH